jgi:hypothetical protein
VQRHASGVAVFGFVFIGSQRQQFGVVGTDVAEDGRVKKWIMENG